MQNEPLKFYPFDQMTPTKSAVCQQRGIFLRSVRVSVPCLYRPSGTHGGSKTRKGYRVPASDGSALNPPYKPSDKETFHENGEKRKVTIKSISTRFMNCRAAVTPTARWLRKERFMNGSRFRKCRRVCRIRGRRFCSWTEDLEGSRTNVRFPPSAFSLSRLKV